MNDVFEVFFMLSFSLCRYRIGMFWLQVGGVGEEWATGGEASYVSSTHAPISPHEMTALLVGYASSDSLLSYC